MRISPLLLVPLLATALTAQAIQLPYFNSYSFVGLGPPPGVPNNLGGLAFRVLDPNNLYIMGAANGVGGGFYKIGVTRDANKHITGFVGTAALVSTADYNDGGCQFGPNDVAFYTRYPVNELGQIKLGSTVPDKVIPLSGLGVSSSVGALCFVPAGYAGTGKLKFASYNASSFHTATLAPDTSGTFDITGVTNGTTIQGGVEGFFYVPPGSPLFTDFRSMMVCEYGSGGIYVYDLDANADPVLATRRAFMTGLGGAEGAAIDPLSGDFLFSTFGGSAGVIAVRGFGLPCGAVVNYGTGTAGTGAFVPRLFSEGCFARNQAVSLKVDQGRGSAVGAMFVGLQQQNVPIFGVTVLVNPLATFNHTLTGSSGAGGVGTWALPLTVPNDTNLLNTDFYFQSVYLDPAGPLGVTATAGLNLRVR